MLSFVIPTLNEERHISVLLEGLVPQLSKNDEIIIVDSHSRDRTAEIVESFGARVLLQPKEGIGLAKTEGARNAKNDILAFMDADCRVPARFVGRLKGHFSNPDVIAVGGLDLYESESSFWKFLYNTYSVGVFHSTRLTHALTGKFWIPANNCAYRRDAFFRVGGYRSVVCEDTDMMSRMPPSRNVVYDDSLVLKLSDRRFRQNGFFRTVALWGISNITCFAGNGTSTAGYRND
ncbi:glycosyltransferase [Candidatus Micrarchaeota archaeon]|nr:glycosyltransferase [Candidatus Micrarchaeota archaeon]